MVLGPVFERGRSSGTCTTAVRPVWSTVRNDEVELFQVDVFYPLFTYDRFGQVRRWQLAQLLRGGTTEIGAGTVDRGLTLFPVLFHRRSTDTNAGYTAVFPLAGTIKDRFFRDEIRFLLWPLFVKTTRTMPGERTGMTGVADGPPSGRITTWNLVAPVFHLRSGYRLRGWQVWPLAGHEHKCAYVFTNQWGECQLSPGHTTSFLFWPVFWHQETGAGGAVPRQFDAILPLYARWQWPGGRQTTYLWPLGPITGSDDAKRLRHFELFWPLIRFTTAQDGETTRLFPFYARTANSNSCSEWYLWPLHNHRLTWDAAGYRTSDRVLFFLFRRSYGTNMITKSAETRLDLWPLLTSRRSDRQESVVRLFAPLEPILGRMPAIERNYAPLWSVYERTRSASGCTERISVLFGLFRTDRAVEHRRTSFLFGLLQVHTRPDARSLRVFGLPVWRADGRAPAAAPNSGIANSAKPVVQKVR